MTREITQKEANQFLADKWGFFGEKEFKGSRFCGKYVCEFKKKFYACDRLSEAAKIIG